VAIIGEKQVVDIPIGFWEHVASGNNVHGSFISGVEKADGTTVTVQDLKNVRKSINSEESFFGLSESVKLNEEQSKDIEESVGNFVSSGINCSNTCAESLKRQFMYQWKMEGGEEDSKWTLSTCHFICRSDLSDPKCPLTGCADNECNTCN
jgi:hypothetical protein